MAFDPLVYAFMSVFQQFYNVLGLSTPLQTLMNGCMMLTIVMNMLSYMLMTGLWL